MNPFSVTILGSSSSTPTSGRNPSSQALKYNNVYFLIDCGEGTQMAIRRNHIPFHKIEHIFISHLHGDHFFGLVGLLSSMNLLGRTKPLHVYADSRIEDIIKIQFQASQTQLAYSLVFHATQTAQEEVLFENEYISITSFPLLHRVPTTGFLFKEKPQPRNIKKDMIERLNLEIENIISIKQGNDYHSPDGKTYDNSYLTEPVKPIRSYAYCSDTAYFEDIIPTIKNVDLLYHEATFLDVELKHATEKFHATAKQAASIASKANAKKLLIGHFSARYDDLTPLLIEAQSVFPNTRLAIEGETFEI